ncbi:MAG: WYL domain-containing protein [Opitutales bacterium]|nr:WYL domain-containing protein [Opitutales bacterium]MCH8540255.1 WYL domain-containing protein [Opitutales bacterium]
MNTELGKWSERQRLAFIERMLFWRGYINRRDVIDYFGISPPQATNDLVHYTTLNPEGCRYNVRKRRYETTDSMKPCLIIPDFGTDTTFLGSQIRPDPDIPFILEPTLPIRNASIPVARELCQAVHRKQSLEIQYWSVNSGSAVWRRITPRGFAHDGLRWHVRAWCHNNGDFRDFVIGRMKNTRDTEVCLEAERIDEDWLTEISLHLRPNPKEKANVRKAIAMDYGMRAQKLILRVRRAMLVYTARRMGFIQSPDPDNLPMLNELQQLEWYKLSDK